MLRLKTILQYNYIYILFLLLAIFLSFIRVSFDNSKYDINETKVEGTLINYKIDGDKFSFEIKGKEKLKCTYYIKTEEEKYRLSNLDLGITISLEGSLTESNENTIPNTFNYKKYLRQNNIFYCFNVQNFKVINKDTSIFYSIKNKIRNRIKNYKSKDYLSSFILGDKQYMSDEIKSDYQSLGVSHIFAISGMHISLLSTIILVILKKLRLKENIAYIIVIIFLLFYMFLTSFQASILRSVGLFILLYINKRFCLDIKVVNVLLLDVTILLLISPTILFNVGFQYSSIVSLSLINYSHLIKGNYVLKCLKVSLIAFLFSLPITLINNFEFNLLTVINNLVIVPFVSFILYPLSVLSFFISSLDNILCFFTSLLEYILTYLLNLNIIIPKINIIVIIVYYVLLILFFKSYKKIFLLGIVLLLTIVKIIPILDPSYNIFFLDVGQGDSTVIKKGSECVLIDTGGRTSFKTDKWKEKKEFFYTDNTVMFLHSIGVSKIDTVILTHGDADHAKEISHLLDKISVRHVIINKGELNYLEKSIPTHLITKTYKGKLDLTILDTGVTYDNENDNSIVTLLNAHNHKLLFMGDASTKTENDLLKKYNIKNIDVLKTGHHGSDTSSGKNFIKSITPKYSVISVGKNNRYGHPKKSVLDNLSNSKIYRTDIDGTISFKINNKGLLIKTYAN